MKAIYLAGVFVLVGLTLLLQIGVVNADDGCWDNSQPPVWYEHNECHAEESYRCDAWLGWIYDIECRFNFRMYEVFI